MSECTPIRVDASVCTPIHGLFGHAGLCLAPNLQQLRTVKRSRHCLALMAEAGSNAYVLHRFHELALLYNLSGHLHTSPPEVDLLVFNNCDEFR